jgi:hypothetical protein
MGEHGIGRSFSPARRLPKALAATDLRGFNLAVVREELSNMKNVLIAIAVSLGLTAGQVEALPLFRPASAPDATLGPIVKVLNKSQKAAGLRACRRQFGARLAFVTYSKTRYTCHYRKSTKALTRAAAKKCRKDGRTLDKVTSIKIKGNKSITRFRCKR